MSLANRTKTYSVVHTDTHRQSQTHTHTHTHTDTQTHTHWERKFTNYLINQPFQNNIQVKWPQESFYRHKCGI